MDKRRVLEEIVSRLSAELEKQVHASKNARADATHEDNRAEDKYDTRATEASYLADGQARLAAELREAVDTYRSLNTRAFAPGEPIALTALVELEQRGARDLYFLGPRGGGLEVRCDGRDIFVITPHSPLGQTLLGKTTGATLRLHTGREAKIVGVS